MRQPSLARVTFAALVEAGGPSPEALGRPDLWPDDVLVIRRWATDQGQTVRHLAQVLRDGAFYGTVTLGLLPDAVLARLGAGPTR